jgi:hypothetical protein
MPGENITLPRNIWGPGAGLRCITCPLISGRFASDFFTSGFFISACFFGPCFLCLPFDLCFPLSRLSRLSCVARSPSFEFLSSGLESVIISDDSEIGFSSTTWTAAELKEQCPKAAASPRSAVDVDGRMVRNKMWKRM